MSVSIERTHVYKTIEVETRYKDELFKKLSQTLSNMGLRKAEVTNDYRIVYSRTYPFSLGASILIFIGIFIIAIAWMQVDYENWLASLSLIERMNTPNLRPNLLTDSLPFSLLSAIAAGFLWGQTKSEWKLLSIHGGSEFLYLRFDVTKGDTYMVNVLDKLSVPFKEVVRPARAI